MGFSMSYAISTVACFGSWGKQQSYLGRGGRVRRDEGLDECGEDFTAAL